MKSKSKHYYGIFTTLLHAILIVAAVTWMYPFLWMLSASFKTQNEFFESGLSLIPKSLNLDNIQRAWGSANFNEYFINSFLVSISTVVIVVFATSLAGYVLGRYSFVGKKVILGILLGSITIPLVFTLIPVYEMLKAMNLSNSLTGLILAESGGGHVVFLLLYSTYFGQLPKEMEEAGEMDGCGFIKTFTHIMFPLAKPVSMTVIIMEFIWSWNDFMLPLTLTLSKPSIRTLSVGLYALKGENVVDWTGIAAGGSIAVMPIIIIFIFLQRYFVEGISGAVKS